MKKLGIIKELNKNNKKQTYKKQNKSIEAQLQTTKQKYKKQNQNKHKQNKNTNQAAI